MLPSVNIKCYTNREKSCALSVALCEREKPQFSSYIIYCIASGTCCHLRRTVFTRISFEQAGAEPVRGGLEDEDILQEGMRGCSDVFHLAAKGVGWGSYEDYYRVNVEGTEHVLTAARAATVPRLVYVSTEAVLAGAGPIVNADETLPRTSHPAGYYGLTKGLAEERVLAANSSKLTTVVVRPRFVWGNGMSALPQLVQMTRSGTFRWIDGGRYLTSTCHVANACEGMLLAAERGCGGETYFLTDGPPIEFRCFIAMLLQTQGLQPGEQSIPSWLARAVAWSGEWAWRILRLKGEPPLTRENVVLIGEEVTVNDARARCELGYIGKVSREEGLAGMSLIESSLSTLEQAQM